jgi:hypothetical protein
MSTTGTQTQTYTVVDIRKVLDHFAADLTMISQATGLWSAAEVANIVSDLKQFAEEGYLTRINLILKDKAGSVIKAAVYQVDSSAVGWTSERPGNNLWPRTPDGTLTLVASLNQKWWDMQDAGREDFIKSHSLQSKWPVSSEDTSFSGLTASSGQRYASNGYGLARKNFN